MKRKLSELQKRCRAKRQKFPTSVAGTFLLAIELLGSADTHMSMAERVRRVNRREGIIFKHENVTDDRIDVAKRWAILLLNT